MKTTAAALVFTAITALPAASAPMGADRQIGANAQVDAIQTVQWRRHHHWNGPRHWRGHHYRPGWGPALGGLAAGAIIGGAIANSQARSDEVAYCSQRFKSYDPASGTYLGYDGMRHPCP
jgi:hypothetical protein